MRRAAVLAAFFSVAVCDIVDETELEDLESEFQADLHRQRHQGHRHNPFLRHPRASLLEQEDPDRTAAPSGLLAGRHPAVENKLRDMGQALRDLNGRQHIASQAQRSLEGELTKAEHHINEVAGIKNQLARTEVHIRAEERKLKRLEEDRLRLDRKHDSLDASLHHIMEPKIDFAESRLQAKKRELRALQRKAFEWKSKSDQFHVASLAMLEERRKSKERIAAAAAAEEKSEQDLKLAEKQFLAAKRDTNLNVESYQFSKAKARAAAAKAQRGEEVEREAESSKARLVRILNMEQRRVDESMAHGKDRLMGKMLELEGQKKRANEKLSKLRLEYADWRDGAQNHASNVAATKQATRAAAQDYADTQQAMVAAAQAEIAQDAESDSDWAWTGDWANSD